MQKIISTAVYTTMLLLAACQMTAQSKTSPDLHPYNVVWNSPSQNETAAMPIGNGRTGVNMWVEENGDLLFYLVRNDSYSETSRLLKLGRIRMHFSQKVFSKETPFRQELDLAKGEIKVVTGKKGQEVGFRIFCDQDTDTIFVKGWSDQSISVTTTLESWRKTEHKLRDKEINGTRGLRDSPQPEFLRESADQFFMEKDGISWFHHNKFSPTPLQIKNQRLEKFKSDIPDPLIWLTSGALITSQNSKTIDKFTIKSQKASKQFDLKIVTASKQVKSPDTNFRKLLRNINKSVKNSEAVAKSTSKWWANFWTRSYIIVDEKIPASMPKGFESDQMPPSRVTQAYILARYVSACQNRDEESPVHFQGGMFIVGPPHMPVPRKQAGWAKTGITPDFCFHGSNYWWQNVRLVYHPLLAQGDFKGIKRFFHFYTKRQPAFEAMAKSEYQAKGLFMREVITLTGLPAPLYFGWGAKTYSEPYTKDIWYQPLELLSMMLDYYDYTKDTAYLTDVITPFGLKVFQFFETRFKCDTKGKIVISPSHAVETYWHDVVNDMPTVAGLQAISTRFLAKSTLSKEDRAFFTNFVKSIPPLPVKEVDGKIILDNAESYKNRRLNYEAPDLYAVFPFRHYGVGMPNIDHAIRAYRKMPNAGHSCWMQTGMFAATLGLAEDAKKDILERSSLFIPNFRFPGYFYSPFDSPPDMDGPGVMQTTLQAMILQTDQFSDRLFITPAWPKDWDASFRLFAPKNTIIEGVIKKGKIVKLKVTPESRRKDIIIK